MLGLIADLIASAAATFAGDLLVKQGGGDVVARRERAPRGGSSSMKPKRSSANAVNTLLRNINGARAFLAISLIWWSIVKFRVSSWFNLQEPPSWPAASLFLAAVESRCGAVAVGRTYLFPPLSSGGIAVGLLQTAVWPEPEPAAA
jgi:hypothetical protein